MNAVDILGYGNGTFRRAFENVPHDHWDIGEVTGYWSVKNIVSHLTSFELALGDILTTFVGDGATPHLDELKRYGTMPWCGVDYCLDDFIVFVNYAHKREHAAEINLYRDRIKEAT